MDWRPPIGSSLNLNLSHLITRDLLIGVVAGFSLAATSASLAAYVSSRRARGKEARTRAREVEEEGEFPFRPIELRSDEIVNGVCGAIGEQVRVGLISLV